MFSYEYRKTLETLDRRHCWQIICEKIYVVMLKFLFFVYLS